MTSRPPLLHEWMHRFEIANGHVVRVWTQADHGCIPDEFLDQHRELRELVDAGAVADIAALPYVNAVEELDRLGNGRLVYVDWP